MHALSTLVQIMAKNLMFDGVSGRSLKVQWLSNIVSIEVKYMDICSRCHNPVTFGSCTDEGKSGTGR